MSALKHILSRYRLILLVVCAALTIFLLYVSNLIGYTTFWGSLLLNLAASVITIGLTIAVIDLVLDKETENRTKILNKHAYADIHATSLILRRCLAEMYGYRVSYKRTPSSVDSLIDQLELSIDEYLSTLKPDNLKLSMGSVNTKSFIEALKDAAIEYKHALTNYGIYMSPTTKIAMIKLVNETDWLNQALNDPNSSARDKKSNIIYSTGTLYPAILDALIGLYNEAF